MQVKDLKVLTIGHSTHSYERFVSLLRAFDVTAIADVRTTPSSRHFPHFNEDTLRSELRLDGIADYEKMAKTELFASGINRVIEGAKKYCVALMCSEHDPLDCHRCLLVGRALASLGVKLDHIMGNCTLMSQEAIEEKLLNLSGRSSDDLLMTASERLSTAYRDRSLKVAYVEPSLDIKSRAAKK
jgi:uncharacterized protein (DUF488 family)